MPPEKREELVWLILFVVAIGVVLLVTTMLLMRAWRRHITRVRGKEPKTPDMPDIWHTSGQRLSAKMSPFPRPDGESHDPDDEIDPFHDDDERD